jgi:drug/metabolite transporter (DMT)-like permease
VLAVSTGAIFARAATAPALVIAAYRVGIAAIILFPLAWWRARHELRRLTAADYGLASLAGLFLALHFATWISSLFHTSVAISVILVNTNPLWVGVLTPLLGSDRLHRFTIFGIVLSVVGGVIIALGDSTTGGTRALWGDFLALLGGVCAALYLLLGRNLRRKLSLLAYITVCYCSAALILWAMVLASQLPITGFTAQTYTMFVALALIPQLIGHSSYNWALRWFSPSLIAVSLLGEPIGSAILAYLIFAEGVTWLTVLGGSLILAALFLAARGEQ